MNINWQFFPKSDEIPSHLLQVVNVFEHLHSQIDSHKFEYVSNDVLAIVRPDLVKLNYLVEASKKGSDKIKIPVLFGRNGSLEKYFDADGFNELTKTVLEVEAGRAVSNYQFLKDLFQACVMHDVDYLVIAVRNTYKDRGDFNSMYNFFETLYASNRLKLPLKGILIIGY